MAYETHSELCIAINTYLYLKILNIHVIYDLESLQ